MPNNILKQEFEYYLANQDRLVEKYDGKYIVIHDQQVVAEYDDELSAVQESQEKYEPGTFLVQLVAIGSAGHTQTFHSRVAFC